MDNVSDGRRSAPAEDPRLCVLCGEPNDCALAESSPSSGEPCWCVAEEFPTLLVESVAREQGQSRCLCRRCLERYRQDETHAANFPSKRDEATRGS